MSEVVKVSGDSRAADWKNAILCTVFCSANPQLLARYLSVPRTQWLGRPCPYRRELVQLLGSSACSSQSFGVAAVLVQA